MAVKVKDKDTGIVLTVPEELLERYRAQGYICPDMKISTEDTAPIEKPLEEWSNKDLVAYGAELGLDLKVNAAKTKLVDAIKEALEANEPEEAEELSTEDVTSQDW